MVLPSPFVSSQEPVSSMAEWGFEPGSSLPSLTIAPCFLVDGGDDAAKPRIKPLTLVFKYSGLGLVVQMNTS